MADNSPIEWLHGHPGGKGATWNVITGCSLESPGCTNCYAMKLAGTRLRNHPSRQGLTTETKNGPVWNGEVRFNEQWLDQPLRWKAPRMIFVCAHGDLFHPAVPYRWIDRVFAVMALAPWHTFLVLTKRAERMRDYMVERTRELSYEPFTAAISRACVETSRQQGNPLPGNAWLNLLDNDESWRANPNVIRRTPGWPLRHVWLGVSIEDRKRMLERAPLLRDTPAALRWWSAEPLLGDLGDIADDLLPDWGVVGGESGDGARPMNIHAVRRFRDRMLGARRPFFFKQWGEWVPYEESAQPPYFLSQHGHEIDGHNLPDFESDEGMRQTEWHCDWSTQLLARRVGKKAAGRMLDGVLYDQYPEPR